MSIELYLAYLLTCFVITIIPGPTVTLIVANSLAHGARAGLLNVVGTQFGLGLMMLVLAVGLTSIIATMGVWFDWLRLIGAAYLIWLGWKLLRANGGLGTPGAAPAPRGGFVLQGFFVLLGNPKALLWFGAFIPQFVDPAGNYVQQVILLGLTAMAAAAISDGAYAVLAGGAGRLMSNARVRLVSRIGGLCLIGGGVWLALARSR
ncbi:MAG: LysE family translocator [Alphaproteobacteria bacterium]|nr:LysE family translocator [Alphaproteobacteria bacterium]